MFEGLMRKTISDNWAVHAGRRDSGAFLRCFFVFVLECLAPKRFMPGTVPVFDTSMPVSDTETGHLIRYLIPAMRSL